MQRDRGVTSTHSHCLSLSLSHPADSCAYPRSHHTPLSRHAPPALSRLVLIPSPIPSSSLFLCMSIHPSPSLSPPPLLPSLHISCVTMLSQCAAICFSSTALPSPPSASLSSSSLCLHTHTHTHSTHYETSTTLSYLSLAIFVACTIGALSLRETPYSTALCICSTLNEVSHYLYSHSRCDRMDTGDSHSPHCTHLLPSLHPHERHLLLKAIYTLCSQHLVNSLSMLNLQLWCSTFLLHCLIHLHPSPIIFFYCDSPG